MPPNRFPPLVPALLVLLVPSLSLAQPQAPNSAPPESGYAPINDLKMYYEIHGEGQPASANPRVPPLVCKVWAFRLQPRSQLALA